MSNGFAITPPTLPNGEVGDYYYQTMSAFGQGSGVNIWGPVSVSGSLPPGLSIGNVNYPPNSFTLSGDPTQDGTYSFTISVPGNIYGSEATQSYTVMIVASPSIATVSPLPSGEVGVAYSQTLEVSGGTAPYRNWSIKPGTTLPAVLVLSQGPLTNGATISGVPKASGVFTFTVEVWDTPPDTNNGGPLTDPPAPATKQLTIPIVPGDMSYVVPLLL